MSQTHPRMISTCALGKHRDIAEKVAPIFNGTTLCIVAMLDVVSPESYTFTKDRLRPVLPSVYPPPCCFIPGEAVDEHANLAAIEACEEYAAENEVDRPLLINLRGSEGTAVEETKHLPKTELAAHLLRGTLKSRFFVEDSWRKA